MNKENLKKIAAEIICLPKVSKEMTDWFNYRTKLHISLVQKYCKKISETNPKFKELVEIGKQHDLSKYQNPEYKPYIFISWKYKCKDDGRKFETSDYLEKLMNKATEQHVKTNKHHPEFYDKKTNIINLENRDKPSRTIINATKMPLIYIAEMVGDWCAMSEEKGTNPKDWADKNVNVRWKFNDIQKKCIYDLISKVFK